MRHLGKLFSVLAGSIFLGGVLPVAAMGLSATGAFGTFTGTSVALTDVGAGTVKLSWNGTATAQFYATVGPLEPAVSTQLVANLVNFGNVDLSTVQIAVTGTNTGPLSDGLQLAIDSCSVPWAGSAPNYTCGGMSHIVSADRPVVGVINLPGSSALTPGTRDFLRFTFRMADSAPNGLMNTSGHVTITATGIQRAGQTK